VRHSRLSRPEGGPARPGRLLAVLALALAAFAPGCAFFSSSPAPASLGDSLGARIADTARSQIGARYRYGGDTPDEGFDCSGLVQWAYARNGVRVPRTVDAQHQAGHPVRVPELGPGDLLFFNTSFKRTTLHVGIATSPDRFVHSPSTGGRVREDRLSDPYWSSVFARARRLTP
jgi:cell wall-associated NlpC family hydrolase